MAIKKKTEEVLFNIEEVIAVLKESDKHDWTKGILKISWGGRPSTVDIRNFNFSQNKAGKGISLTQEETEEIVNHLLEKDYGSIDILENALKRKKSRIFKTSEIEEAFEPKQYYRIRSSDD